MNFRMMIGVLGTLTLICSQAGIAADEDAPKVIDPHGRPKKFIQGKHRMYGIWYEDGVWKLRTTSGKRVRLEFRGTVTIDRDRITPDPTGLDRDKRLKNSDLARLSKNRRKMDFRFVTIGQVDTLDFKVGKKAKTVTFNLRIGDDDDPRFIFVGAESANPKKAVFTLPAHPVKPKAVKKPTPQQ